MEKPDIQSIASAILRDEPYLKPDMAYSMAKDFSLQMDERLIPNVIEWLNGQSMTDIWIGEYCVGLIHKITNRSYFACLEMLNLYAHDTLAGTSSIWRGKR